MRPETRLLPLSASPLAQVIRTHDPLGLYSRFDLLLVPTPLAGVKPTDSVSAPSSTFPVKDPSSTLVSIFTNDHRSDILILIRLFNSVKLPSSQHPLTALSLPGFLSVVDDLLNTIDSVTLLHFAARETLVYPSLLLFCCPSEFVFCMESSLDANFLSHSLSFLAGPHACLVLHSNLFSSLSAQSVVKPHIFTRSAFLCRLS